MHDDPPPGLGCATKALLAFLFIIAIALALLGRAGCGPCAFPRRVSGVVVDENGQPVSGVAVSLEWSTGMGLSRTSPSDEHKDEVKSDAAGHFSGWGSISNFSLRAQKEGYYPTSFIVSDSMSSQALRIPLNTIRHPQPMLGKRAYIRLPSGSNRFEYDLLAGDCLPPHGKGLVADLLIEWRKPDRTHGEYPRDVISVRVPGEGNGVTTQRIRINGKDPVSKLRSTHLAPENGYAATFAEADQLAGSFTGAYNGAEKVHCLKIRSGLTPGPFFGKIKNDVLFMPRAEEDEFEFYYFLNPSGDRSLEVDIKQITVPSKHQGEHPPDFF